ncbi:MAG: hypothetical protein ACKPAF_03900, partial [Actinomycetota bacterium]
SSADITVVGSFDAPSPMTVSSKSTAEMTIGRVGSGLGAAEFEQLATSAIVAKNKADIPSLKCLAFSVTMVISIY